MDIIDFLKKINLLEFIDEIKLICNLNQKQYDELSKTISENLENFGKLSPQQEVHNIRQSISQAIENSGNQHEEFRQIVRTNSPVSGLVNGMARTGISPISPNAMRVIEGIGFVISIPFRIIFFFIQLRGR